MTKELEEGKQMNELASSKIQVELLELRKTSMQSYMDRSHTRNVLLPAEQEDSFYRFTCHVQRIPSLISWVISTTLFDVILFAVYLLLYIRQQIIQPFHSMEAIAAALKDRDFTYKLSQQEHRFFDKFIWTIDVVKEELRHHEKKETMLMKEKQTIIASLFHDTKAPLSNIRLYTDAMKEHLCSEELICERLYGNYDKIDQYVKEIMHTNNEDLFDFDVYMEEVCLHDVEVLLRRKQECIELALISYGQSPCRNQLVYMDLTGLRKVIGNIVDNVMKYGDGERIHVSFYKEDHHSILKLENSGSYTEQSDAGAIFQNFYRGNNVNSHAGNDLGLYIYKQLMQKMDGDIFMTQKQGGVSFHLVLDTLQASNGIGIFQSLGIVPLRS